MSRIVVGSGYTLHYTDSDGHHISIPIEMLEATYPQLVHDEVVCVTFDEAATFSVEDLKRLDRPRWTESLDQMTVEVDYAAARELLKCVEPRLEREPRAKDWTDRQRQRPRKRRKWGR